MVLFLNLAAKGTQVLPEADPVGTVGKVNVELKLGPQAFASPYPIGLGTFDITDSSGGGRDLVGLVGLVGRDSDSAVDIGDDDIAACY